MKTSQRKDEDFVSKKLLVVLVLVMSLGIPLTVHANGAPWPPDLKIVPVEQNAPAHLVPLLGKWVGSSNSGMGLRMAVEKIYLSEFGLLKIDTVYAWDNRFVAPGWSRQPATFIGTPSSNNQKGEITYSVASNALQGARISCQLPTGDSMNCTWAYGRAVGTASFKREK